MGTATFWHDGFEGVTNEESLAQAHALAAKHGSPEAAVCVHQLIATLQPHFGFAVFAYPLTYSTHFNAGFPNRLREPHFADNLEPMKHELAQIAIASQEAIKSIHERCFAQPYTALSDSDRQIAADQFRHLMQLRFSDPGRDLIIDMNHLDSGVADRTEGERLVLARLGQGQFRASVFDLWGERCAVSGATTLCAIQAAHIKPWNVCESGDRLNPANGIPLTASLHSLFDAGLFAIDENDCIVVSGFLPSEEADLFGLVNKQLNEVPAESRQFLEYHRQTVFREA